MEIEKQIGQEDDEMKAVKAEFLMMRAGSDFYRAVSMLLDWRCHLRFFSGKLRYDAACITNLETSAQKEFMGLHHREVANGLRFSLGSSLGRYVLINQSAKDIDRDKTEARILSRRAIEGAVTNGAKVVLFAASLKRIFSSEELREFRWEFPGVTFTLGDNGTVWSLLCEVFRAVEELGLNSDSKILITGPNGLLGSVVRFILEKHGYSNLILASAYGENPFEQAVGVELVIACSHRDRVRLTADVLKKIAHPIRGVLVIDPCRPAALVEREFLKCPPGVVKRRDAGNTYNPRIRYIFPLGAEVILRQLGLSNSRLLGCFSEAIALAGEKRGDLEGIDFLSVNCGALGLIERVFPQKGFEVSPPTNFGVLLPVKTKRANGDQRNKAGLLLRPAFGNSFSAFL